MKITKFQNPAGKLPMYLKVFNYGKEITNI